MKTLLAGENLAIQHAKKRAYLDEDEPHIDVESRIYEKRIHNQDHSSGQVQTSEAKCTPGQLKCQIFSRRNSTCSLNTWLSIEPAIRRSDS